MRRNQWRVYMTSHRRYGVIYAEL